MHDPFNPDAVDLEAAFFARENAELLERLRAKAARADQHAALREVLPNADEATLDRLIELGIKPETALAVVLVPLAAVAWADGEIDPKERAAILHAAEERGVTAGGAAHQLLSDWLSSKPGPEVLDAWQRYVRSVWPALNEDERRQMRERSLGMAERVAEAAGGFLGFGSRVSAAERAVLDRIAETLT
jgi:tellurite resistance protein